MDTDTALRDVRREAEIASKVFTGHLVSEDAGLMDESLTASDLNLRHSKLDRLSEDRCHV